MALGIAGEQGHLAHQISEIVQDEGEAATELLEALGLGERLAGSRLADQPRSLAADDAQHVEILPVDTAPDIRARQQWIAPTSFFS